MLYALFKETKKNGSKIPSKCERSTQTRISHFLQWSQLLVSWASWENNPLEDVSGSAQSRLMSLLKSSMAIVCILVRVAGILNLEEPDTNYWLDLGIFPRQTSGYFHSTREVGVFKRVFYLDGDFS
jgi:hypothetical protein